MIVSLTQEVSNKIPLDVVMYSLGLYFNGDWGNLEYEEDIASNNRNFATNNGGILMGVYSWEGEEYWVYGYAGVEDPPPTVLFPHEY